MDWSHVSFLEIVPLTDRSNTNGLQLMWRAFVVLTASLFRITHIVERVFQVIVSLHYFNCCFSFVCINRPDPICMACLGLAWPVKALPGPAKLAQALPYRSLGCKVFSFVLVSIPFWISPRGFLTVARSAEPTADVCHLDYFELYGEIVSNLSSFAGPFVF